MILFSSRLANHYGLWVMTISIHDFSDQESYVNCCLIHDYLCLDAMVLQTLWVENLPLTFLFHFQIKIFSAKGLHAADLGGKSDPFVVLEIDNTRLQTHTEYKTITPTWNRILNLPVGDIHSVLHISVYDEDRNHKYEFLGKIAFPLLNIDSGQKRWFALKDKKLRARAKGHNPQILLQLDLQWNSIRAAIRTFDPKEERYMATTEKFKRYVILRTFRMHCKSLFKHSSLVCLFHQFPFSFWFST